MITNAELERLWQEATIQNNYIFSKTMEMHPELCRRLIEKILQIKIRKIEYPEREKVLEERLDAKGIRLDVYVEDDNNRVFDLEMQIADSDNIAKRMRYYQALIDGDKLKRGEHYSVLGESYIIFICCFDKFNRGRHIYTFRNRCDEDNLSLNDGAVKIFLNTKGTADDVGEDVKNFLDYVERGIVAGEFVQEMDLAVQDVKFNKRARLGFMTFEMFLKEREMQSREEGREEGREEKAFEMVKNLLLAKTPLKYIVAATGWSEEKILRMLNNDKP